LVLKVNGEALVLRRERVRRRGSLGSDLGGRHGLKRVGLKGESGES